MTLIECVVRLVIEEGELKISNWLRMELDGGVAGCELIGSLRFLEDGERGTGRESSARTVLGKYTSCFR